MEDDVLPGYVAVARVLGASGVRGEMKVEALGPHSIFKRGRPVNVAGRRSRIARASRAGRQLRIKLEGIDDRESAAALRGAYVQVEEDSLEPLPEGEYYRFQLIGLQAVTTDGRELGRITDVLSTAETDVFVVSGPLGEVLIPATDEVVHEVDLAARQVRVEAIPGLLPE